MCLPWSLATVAPWCPLLAFGVPAFVGTRRKIQTKIVGTAAARREAIVVEIRTKEEAKEGGLDRLVLDNNEV